MEPVSYNQMQWKKRPRTIERCKECGNQIIWMRTSRGRPVMVHPMKVINHEPGVKIIDEQGLELVNLTEKIGWKVHECKAIIAPRVEADRAAYQG